MLFTHGNILLEKYRIENLIDAGSVGKVYLATHLQLNVPRAIKILHRKTPGLSSSEYDDFIKRFQDEAYLGAKLDHPNLVRVHNFDQDEQVLVLEMEYCPGGNLAQLINQARHANTSYAFPIERAVRIALEISRGLAELHGLGVVHRDVKPTNILFSAQGIAKLGDLSHAQLPGGLTIRSNTTYPTPQPGTIGYMSPEQENQNRNLNSASDIFVLGLVLFEMLTGYACNNQRPGTRASSLRPVIPGELDELLAQMLAKDPEQRPWNGTEAAKKLETVSAALLPISPPVKPAVVVQPRPVAPAPPAIKWTKWLAGAGVLGAIGIFLVIAIIAVAFISSMGREPTGSYLPPTATRSYDPPIEKSNPEPTSTTKTINQVKPTTQPQAAPTSTRSPTKTPTDIPEPRIFNFFACKTQCNPSGSNATTTFSEGVSKIYLYWEFENVPEGSDYVRSWESNGEEWVRYQCTWPGPANGFADLKIYDNDGGLRSGTWEITFSIDGTVIFRTQIRILGSYNFWLPVGVKNVCY